MTRPSRWLAVATLVMLATIATPADGPQVRRIVSQRIATLGHRNWIVIADSAYPQQMSPGVETITVGESQIEAVKTVLAELRRVRNVRPIIHLDSELKFVPESNSPGIDRFRTQLATVLKGQPVQRQLHEKIIAKLDETGKTFRVLLIKTPHTMPYTSVFIELQCGYWSDAAERDLRARMKIAGN